jgi:hypothetical protein
VARSDKCQEIYQVVQYLDEQGLVFDGVYSVHLPHASFKVKDWFFLDYGPIVDDRRLTKTFLVSAVDLLNEEVGRCKLWAPKGTET